MSPPVGRPSVGRSLGSLDTRTAQIEAGLGPWVYASLLNGWTNAGPPYSDVAYRRGVGPECLEFKGHAMPGSSGSIAFIIDEDYWPTYDMSFLVDIVNGGGFSVARVFVDHTTGETTITYPAT